MAYYTPKGTLVQDHKMDGSKGEETSVIEMEISAAAARCGQGASAKQELATLFKKHPLLKDDKWQMGEHPVSPLIEWFTRQTLG